MGIDLFAVWLVYCGACRFWYFLACVGLLWLERGSGTVGLRVFVLCLTFVVGVCFWFVLGTWLLVFIDYLIVLFI